MNSKSSRVAASFTRSTRSAFHAALPRVVVAIARARVDAGHLPQGEEAADWAVALMREVKTAARGVAVEWESATTAAIILRTLGVPCSLQLRTNDSAAPWVTVAESAQTA